MTNRKQKQLYILLQQYMQDLLNEDEQNHDDMKVNHYGYVTGVKAQFNHARCIARRLGVKIEKEIL